MLRGEMKAMIQAIYINKAEAHDKITAAVSRAMEQTRAHQVSYINYYSMIPLLYAEDDLELNS